MAKRLPSTLPNMFIVLSAIAIVSAGVLGFTYSKMEPVIAQAQAEKRAEALRQVLTSFDNDPVEESVTPEEYPRLTFYPATNDGSPIGTAVDTYTEQGYSGTFRIMVGFDPDLVITGIAVLNHRETPGLGANMTKDRFQSQFEGFDPSEQELAVSKDGGDVDAITAATITSRAVCDAIERAYNAIQEVRGAN